MKLYTSADAYHEAADRMNRSRGENITVPRRIYNALVLDHGRLVGAAMKLGEKIEIEKEAPPLDDVI